MHTTLRRRLSGLLLLAVFAAVGFFTGSNPAYAQSQTRSFQMALWSDPSTDGNGDIPTFFFGQQSQPASGLTVLVGYNQQYDYSLGNVGGVTINWSRVVAVEVDEPYASIDGNLDTCQDVPAGLSTIDSKLQQRANELKALNPKARFWVNLDSTEAAWIATKGCPDVFNRTYIDVISTDSYDVYFSDISLSGFYSVLAANHAKQPSQQWALIPGVFSGPTNQLPYLQDYFDYANKMNQNCNLPLPSGGPTGNYDRCPVWIVMGFQAPNYQNIVGLLDTRSALIAQAWQKERKLPPGPSQQHARAKKIQPVLQLLLQ